MTHMLLRHGGVLKSGAMTQQQYWGSIWSALVHDFEHGGLNNDFLIKTQHPLAIIYNDQSPLENHHVSAASRLLRDPELAYLPVRSAVCVPSLPFPSHPFPSLPFPSSPPASGFLSVSACINSLHQQLGPSLCLWCISFMSSHQQLALVACTNGVHCFCWHQLSVHVEGSGCLCGVAECHAQQSSNVL